MTKTLKCVDVDWGGKGRVDCPVSLELELKRKDGHWCLSICGEVRGPSGQFITWGQCLDEIFRFKAMDPWRPLHRIWRDWHLNDLTPGSPKQEEAVRKWRERRRKAGTWDGGWDYEEACKMLERKGLLVDKSFRYHGRPYRYGTAWLVRDIPADVLRTVRAFMDGKEPK